MAAKGLIPRPAVFVVAILVTFVGIFIANNVASIGKLVGPRKAG